MGNLKSIMCLVVLSVMTTSCVSLTGQIDVKQPMAAKKKSGFLNLKTKEIQIQPDLYSAELKMNGDKNFTLKLEGREKILIPIKSSKNLNVPANGRIFISNTDISQPFDVSGNISTQITNSDWINDVVNCTYTVTENHCTKVCEKPDACSIECKDVSVSLNGRQELTYHYRTTHRDLNINFLKVDKGEVLASFHGTNTDVDQITDYRGICR